MEGAIWLLGIGWGYLIKKVTEYRTIKDGLLAIMHDRLYQSCTHYIQQGGIDTAGLKNLEYLYKSYHALGAMARAPSCTTAPRPCPSVTDTPTQARQRREKGQTMNNLNNKISAGTIARTACLLLALTNQILSACGKPVLPIESATVEQLVTAGITTVAALVAWWQNNSFTAAAIQADKYLEDKKSQVNK